MSDHFKVHPEPEEGCQECAHTRRPDPRAGMSIEERLKRLRIRDDRTKEEWARLNEESRRRISERLDKLRDDAEDDASTDRSEIEERIARESSKVPLAEGDQNRARNIELLMRRACEENPEWVWETLLQDMAVENPTPDLLFNIARYLEMLDGKEVALDWWEKAAAAGHEEAIAYMMLQQMDGDDQS